MENKYDEDDTIILPDDMELVRVYDYLPYTHWQIKKFLAELGFHLEPITWYKCNRIPNYRQRYRIIETATGRVINECVNNDTLRHFFAGRGYPLAEQTEDALYDETGRNIKAKEFMELFEKNSRKGS